MIRLELSGSLSKAYDDRVDGTSDGAHQDAGQHESHDKPNRRTSRLYVPGRWGIINEELSVFIEGQPKGATQKSDGQAQEEEHISNQIVRDDGFPATIFEQGDHVLSGLKVATGIRVRRIVRTNRKNDVRCAHPYPYRPTYTNAHLLKYSRRLSRHPMIHSENITREIDNMVDPKWKTGLLRLTKRTCDADAKLVIVISCRVG